MRIIGEVGECYQVLNSDGMSCGYIYKGYVSSSPVEAFEPVSYTHLDVYKRQASTGSTTTTPPAGSSTATSGSG